jgi:hypothetical protein
MSREEEGNASAIVKTATVYGVRARRNGNLKPYEASLTPMRTMLMDYAITPLR